VSTPPASASHRPGDEADRVRRRFERLVDAGVAIVSQHALGDVLQAVADAARDVVGARYAALGVLGGEDGRELVQFVTSGVTAEERARIGAMPRGHGLLGEMIRTGRPVRLARPAQHPAATGVPAHHPPVTTFLGVPVIGRSRTFGHLYLTEKLDADGFTEEDEAIAVKLAADAAAAIENARLYEETSTLLARVQAMQRQRDQFFAMINHELRNALTGVYGWAEQVQRARSEPAVRKAAQEVYESAERTITLMNNLLDLSRLDATKMQPVIKDTDVRRVVLRAVSAVQPQADAKGVELAVDGCEGAFLCRTDGPRLEQVLINLLANAVRHSRSGDPVLVRGECTAEEIVLHVIDRGPGIPVDDQERIFEPFIRVDPETGLGSGLGLPVSRRLTELIGGRLTVHSALGRGATFTVAVPNIPPERGTVP
jgi:signal transduction histidine kinase